MLFDRVGLCVYNRRRSAGPLFPKSLSEHVYVLSTRQGGRGSHGTSFAINLAVSQDTTAYEFQDSKARILHIAHKMIVHPVLYPTQIGRKLFFRDKTGLNYGTKRAKNRARDLKFKYSAECTLETKKGTL